MKLTQEQEQKLSELVDAGNRLEAARERLRDAVFAALDADVPQSRVAGASGLGRTTLWRWLNGEESDDE